MSIEIAKPVAEFVRRFSSLALRSKGTPQLTCHLRGIAQHVCHVFLPHIQLFLQRLLPVVLLLEGGSLGVILHVDSFKSFNLDFQLFRFRSFGVLFRRFFVQLFAHLLVS